MNKACQLHIKGIQCDNPECDYKDLEAEFDNDKYLNMPCPKCGAPLLTQEDYDAVNQMIAMTEMVSDMFDGVDLSEEASAMVKLEMNGTGSIHVSDIEVIDEKH